MDRTAPGQQCSVKRTGAAGYLTYIASSKQQASIVMFLSCLVDPFAFAVLTVARGVALATSAACRQPGLRVVGGNSRRGYKPCFLRCAFPRSIYFCAILFFVSSRGPCFL